jgi:hypothetical protein
MSSFHQPVWNHLEKPELGFMRTFSNAIYNNETKHPGHLPDLRYCQTILVGSDYGGQHNGGQHNGVRYQSLSFILADLERCGTWEHLRRNVRAEYLADGRRISYKTLSDKNRRKALYPFLEAANAIPGVVITILIDRNIRSLFREEGSFTLDEPEKSLFVGWRPDVIEKSLRIVHMLSFFLAGLTAPGQDVMWFTDQDEIAPNEQRLRQLVNLFANISSHYLAHDLGHLRIGTAMSDSGTRELEDLLAIPDLVAGCLTDILTAFKRDETFPKEGAFLTPKQDVPEKTKEIANWFADHTQRLKRVVYVLDEEPETKHLRSTVMHFWGTRDL